MQVQISEELQWLSLLGFFAEIISMFWRLPRGSLRDMIHLSSHQAKTRKDAGYMRAATASRVVKSA